MDSAKNARRFYLIDRQIAGSIAEGEAGELATLQAQMGRWLDKVAPLPMEYVRQLHSVVERVSVAVVTTPGRKAANFIIWRCPGCRTYLGNKGVPTSCPACDAEYR